MYMKKALITICIASSFTLAASLFLNTNLFSYLYQNLYGYWSLVICAFCYCLVAYSAAHAIYHAGRYVGYKKCMSETSKIIEEAQETIEKKYNHINENIKKSEELLSDMNNSTDARK